MESIISVLQGVWAWMLAMVVLTILWGASQLIKMQVSKYDNNYSTTGDELMKSPKAKMDVWMCTVLFVMIAVMVMATVWSDASDANEIIYIPPNSMFCKSEAAAEAMLVQEREPIGGCYNNSEPLAAFELKCLGFMRSSSICVYNIIGYGIVYANPQWVGND